MNKTQLEQLLAATPKILQESLDALDEVLGAENRKRTRALLADLHDLEARAAAADSDLDRETYTELVEARLRTIRLQLVKAGLVAEGEESEVMALIASGLDKVSETAKELIKAAAAGAAEGLARGAVEGLQEGKS